MPRLLADAPPEAIVLGKSAIRAMRAAGQRYATRMINSPGGLIVAKIAGEQESIKVLKPHTGYEFWTNDDFRLYADGLGSAANHGFASGSGVHLSRGGVGHARFSNTLVADPSKGQTWQTVPIDRLTSVTPSSGLRCEPGWFYTKWSWQDQKMFEHSWWKNGKANYLVTSALGANYGWATRAPANAVDTTAYAPVTTFRYREGFDSQTRPIGADSGFDIKTCTYAKGDVFVGASRQQGPQVWYRRAAVQTVELPGGGKRDYVIHSDTHGNFTVFPLGEYQNVEKYADLYVDNPIAYADLPPSVAKVFTPPYPGWVSRPSTAVDADTTHWLWQFNKDGTRCASTPTENVDAYVWIWDAISLTLGIRAPLEWADFRYNYNVSALDQAAPTVPPSGFDREWQYQRVRLYVLDRTNAAATAEDFEYPYAVMYDGVLRATSLNLYGTPRESTPYIDSWAQVPNPAVYVPAKTYLPGLLELGITITADDTDPYDFDVQFQVLRDEPYSATKRYRIDAAYYMATPRTADADKAAGLLDDDLLVAEVEVYWTPGTDDDSVGMFLNPTVAQGGVLSYRPTVSTPPGAMEKTYRHLHADEPLLESWFTGRFQASGVYAYYTARKHDTQQVVKRICLAHNERWEQGRMDVVPEVIRALGGGVRFMGSSSIGFNNAVRAAGRLPDSFIALVDVADLRFLNFLTRTYTRAAATPPTGTPTDATSLIYPYLFELAPNHHLRIHGQAPRSILYGEVPVGWGTDPAGNLIDPPGTADLLPSIPRGGAPNGNEGTALAMQQWFAARFVAASILPGASIPAHPKGHWSACANLLQTAFVDFEPTADLLVPLPGSTEGTRRWFDAIHREGAQDTTHRDAFNTAFGQERDYSHYEGPGELGTFMAGALWVMN